MESKMNDEKICERCKEKKDAASFVKINRHGIKTSCLTCQDCRDKAKRYREINGCCEKPTAPEAYPRQCKRCGVPKEKESFQTVRDNGKPYIFRMCNDCRLKKYLYSQIPKQAKPPKVVKHIRPEQSEINDLLKGKW